MNPSENDDTYTEEEKHAVSTQVEKLLEFAHADHLDLSKPLLPALPPARTLAMDILDAIAFRKCMADHCPTIVCAICGVIRAPKDMALHSPLPITDIPNLHLLSTNGVASDEFPRSGLTTYSPPLPSTIKSCMQPAGISAAGVNVCSACMQSLMHKSVPMGSFVRFDTGSMPNNLAPLTMIEENLVSLYRVCRYVYVVRPNISSLQPSDTLRKALRGHVIAFPNAPISDLTSIMPLPIDRIPDVMQVVFVLLANNEDDFRTAAAKAKPLKIRGKLVAEWAVFLCKVRQFIMHMIAVT